METANAAVHFGFLTTTELEGWGLCGGLLVVNQLARPVEFHCTLPIKVSRTQSILYGPTLHPFLRGQVIGKALMEKVKVPVQLLLTDCLQTSAVRWETPTPLAFLTPGSGPVEGSDDDPQVRTEAMPKRDATSQLTVGFDFQEPGPSITIAQHRLQLWAKTDVTPDIVDQLRRPLLEYSRQNDLLEPFERIRQAIADAHEVAKRAA